MKSDTVNIACLLATRAPHLALFVYNADTVFLAI